MPSPPASNQTELNADCRVSAEKTAMLSEINVCMSVGVCVQSHYYHLLDHPGGKLIPNQIAIFGV